MALEFYTPDNDAQDPVGDRLMAMVNNLNLLVDKMDKMDVGAISFQDRAELERVLGNLPPRFDGVRNLLRSSNEWGLDIGRRVLQNLTNAVRLIWVGIVATMTSQVNGNGNRRMRTNFERTALVSANDLIPGVVFGATQISTLDAELRDLYPILKPQNVQTWSAKDLLELVSLIDAAVPYSRITRIVYTGAIGGNVRVIATAFGRTLRAAAGVALAIAHDDPNVMYTRHNITQNSTLRGIGVAGQVDNGNGGWGGGNMAGGDIINLYFDHANEAWHADNALTCYTWSPEWISAVAALQNALTALAVDANVALPTVGTIAAGTGAPAGGIPAAVTIAELIQSPGMIATLGAADVRWYEWIQSICKVAVIGHGLRVVARA